MTPLRSRLRHEEGGWALVTAIILMSVMLATGLAFSSVVDTQQGASREQRERETAFNLAESALSAQLFSFSRPAGWPGQGYQTDPYPQCTQASTDLRCPNDTQLRSAFTSVDLDPAATWETSVRDNNETRTRRTSTTTPRRGAPGLRHQRRRQGLGPRPCHGQGQDPHARGHGPHLQPVRGRPQVRAHRRQGVLQQRGQQGVRRRRRARAGPLLPTATNLCIGNDNRVDLATQMPGSTPVYDPLIPPAITPEARERLKQTAISNGTFYASCGSGQPPSAAGAVVYVERGPCSWRGNGVYNSPAKPGLLIMERGLLEMKEDYYGVIYHANLDNTTAKIVDTSGNGHINGGVLVDGPGLLQVGDSKENVIFDPNAFESVKSYGSAGVIQNTWREIKSQ
jgi:Tfp pilus assembly protein PilX